MVGDAMEANVVVPVFTAENGVNESKLHFLKNFIKKG